MDDYLRQRTEAAKWIHARKDRVYWWQWRVLTDRNNDPECLRLPPKIAFQIFADLYQRGLLVPTFDDQGSEAFSINLGREPEWEAITHPTKEKVRAFGRRTCDWIIGGVIGLAIGIWWDNLLGK